MKLAIMQPYLFPYLGYFCLIDACDTFVFYDDVNFIKKGWINRNRIAMQGKSYMFSVPLANSSQNVLITDTRTHNFLAFKGKFLKQLEQAYRNAPYFAQGMGYVQAVLDGQQDSIAQLAARSVTMACDLIGLSRHFIMSSVSFADSRGMPRAERLIHISRQLGASDYVNATGGRALYDKSIFAMAGVRLHFVAPACPPYPQSGKDSFLQHLSIIDVLMYNNANYVKDMVGAYEFS